MDRLTHTETTTLVTAYLVARSSGKTANEAYQRAEEVLRGFEDGLENIDLYCSDIHGARAGDSAC